MSGIQVEMTQETKKFNPTKLIRYIICIGLCILSIYPFYMLILNSCLTDAYIQKAKYLLMPFGEKIDGKNLYNPIKVFADNYKGLQSWCKDAQVISIWKAMLNSFLITVPTTVLQVYFASLTAYAITVYNFKFKKLAWGFIYAIMMIPTQVSIVGLLKVCDMFHIMNTYVPLIIPAMAAPTTVYFMKQYMESGFSVEIVEAARIDGSGEFKTFNTIALPLLKPAMATQAIFAFVASWNNLYTPSLILAEVGKEKGTLPMYIQAIQSNDKQKNFGYIYVAIFLAVMPILIAYLVLSKYIVAGVALGGVKE